ncbi:sporulation sigma factor SigE [Faecalibacillus faecis]|uniref:RNA polymerase sigma factor n=1 Tax=Faecalibacillus faecis TaxID=1982628 RepID=A0A2T3FYN8_9FIRM|nr:RNA polymerase sporulation sigma factor SigK [Faecalibacillus faecis]PST40405.1 sporulation sigma factor SigE [Faecalibacillus faecis]
MWDVFRQFLNQNQFLYYIGKHDILPPPLKGEEERKVIEQAVSGNQKARDTLIEHNLRLVVYVAKRYDNSTNCPLEDLISIGTIGLVKAINTFKADKNIKLATYASRCIENEILMYLRKNNKIRYEISLDEPLNIDYDGNELLLGDIVGTDDDLVEQEMMKSDQRKLFYEALKDLNEREKEILILRYGLSNHDELTQKDVAKLLGISQSYISRLEKKIIKKLRNQLNFDEVKE